MKSAEQQPQAHCNFTCVSDLNPTNYLNPFLPPLQNKLHLQICVLPVKPRSHNVHLAMCTPATIFNERSIETRVYGRFGIHALSSTFLRLLSALRTGPSWTNQGLFD